MNRFATILSSQMKNGMPRQRRGGCQPGATPRVSCPDIIVRTEGAEVSRALSGRNTMRDVETQGVALG
jgi:hypothetical protein